MEGIQVGYVIQIPAHKSSTIFNIFLNICIQVLMYLKCSRMPQAPTALCKGRLTKPRQVRSVTTTGAEKKNWWVLHYFVLTVSS